MAAIDTDIIEQLASRSSEITPAEALDKLIEVYIENCGVSTGMRTVADYAADYWIKEWKRTCPDVPDDVFVLYDVMPLRSEYYRAHREEIDEYDTTIMSNEELREVCLEMVNETDDLRTQIALSAGIVNFE